MCPQRKPRCTGARTLVQSVHSRIRMRRSGVLWLLAILITATAAVYQRVTAPMHPKRGIAELAGRKLHYRLPRSATGGDVEVRVPAVSRHSRGTLLWKRLGTGDDWTHVEMEREGDELVGRLPQQPRGGRLAYRVILEDGDERASLGSEPVTIVFRGKVPVPVLALHVIAMLGALLVGTRAGLEFFSPKPEYRRFVTWTLGMLAVGGLVLGTMLQKYVSGAYWIGWPFGTDATDNKTAVAVATWFVAWLRLRYAPDRVGAWVLGAAIVMLAVFAIPHT